MSVLPEFATVRFLWPAMLWLLVVVPGIAALYVARRVARRATHSRFPGLEGVTQAAGRLAAARAHLAALLVLAGLAALLLAAARPQAEVVLPERVERVVLALDVSGSMRAADVEPDRIGAAREAVRAFVAAQPGHVRIGVVAFAAAALLVQSPTENREEVLRAIERLEVQAGTALGSGLALGLATLLPEARIDVAQPDRSPPPAQPVAPGSRRSVALVLLSDGEANIGPDPLAAARLAATHGVRVYTVGVGTAQGTTLSVEGWSMRVRLDEAVLHAIADLTHGEYFRTGDAGELRRIYEDLGAQIALGERRAVEITAPVTALGIVLALLGGLGTVVRAHRVV